MNLFNIAVYKSSTKVIYTTSLEIAPIVFAIAFLYDLMRQVYQIKDHNKLLSLYDKFKKYYIRNGLRTSFHLGLKFCFGMLNYFYIFDVVCMQV